MLQSTKLCFTVQNCASHLTFGGYEHIRACFINGSCQEGEEGGGGLNEDTDEDGQGVEGGGDDVLSGGNDEKS